MIILMVKNIVAVFLKDKDWILCLVYTEVFLKSELEYANKRYACKKSSNP